MPKCSMEGKEREREIGYKLECEYLGRMLQGDGGCDKYVTRSCCATQTRAGKFLADLESFIMSHLTKLGTWKYPSSCG